MKEINQEGLNFIIPILLLIDNTMLSVLSVTICAISMFYLYKEEIFSLVFQLKEEGKIL